MADLFGAPSGFSQSLQDLNFMARAPMELQRLGQEIQQGNIQTQTMQMDLDARKKMIAAMSKMGQGQAPTNPADYSHMMGTLYMQAGLPEQGMKAFSEEELIRSRQASEGAARARTLVEMGNVQKQQLEEEGRELESVNDQAGLDAFTQRFEETTGRPAPWAGQPYSPALKDQIGKTFLTQAQRLKFALDKQKFDALERVRATNERLKEAQLKLQKWRAEQAVAGKTGKGAVHATTQETARVARRLRLTHSSFASAPMDLQDNLAAKIADDAKGLMAKNKGMTFEDAMNQAMNSPSVRDDLKSVSDAHYAGSFWSKFSGEKEEPTLEEPARDQGQTSANPLPTQASPSDYKEGMWYMDPSGTPRKFVGGMFYSEEELPGAD
jgi:hypothetical protein